MGTIIDNFLVSNLDLIVSNIPVRDKRILTSLVKQLKSNIFLTENQANLILKIFKENSIEVEDEEWSKPFRKISHIRKMFIDNDKKLIVVEFTFNKRLKAVVSELAKKAEGQVTSNLKNYTFDLTEKNVHLLLRELKNDRFDIDPVLQEYFEEISAIISENSNPFRYPSLPESIITALQSEISDTSNTLLVTDRRLKYQYTMDTLIKAESLAERLATRLSPKVFVSNSTISLSELMLALNELNRFPLMFVFDPHNSTETLANLETIATIKDIADSMGVYFRFENVSDDNTNNKFNQYIKNNKLNAVLDSSTRIVGIANNHLPKFMINNDWYPRTVISFVNNFKANKTSVFCNEVDMIIYYNKSAPIGIIDEIV